MGAQVTSEWSSHEPGTPVKKKRKKNEWEMERVGGTGARLFFREGGWSEIIWDHYSEISSKF